MNCCRHAKGTAQERCSPALMLAGGSTREELRRNPHSDGMIRASEEEPGAAAPRRDCRETEKIGSSLEIKAGVEVGEEGEGKEGEERSGRTEEWKAGRRR